MLVRCFNNSVFRPFEGGQIPTELPTPTLGNLCFRVHSLLWLLDQFLGRARSKHIVALSSTEAESMASRAFKKITRNNPFIVYGLPMVSLTVLGSLGLSHLQQGRRDVVKAREDEEWAVLGASKSLSREGPLPGFEQRKKKKIDLEQELQTFREKYDIDAFEYKPVPKVRQVEE